MFEHIFCDVRTVKITLVVVKSDSVVSVAVVFDDLLWEVIHFIRVWRLFTLLVGDGSHKCGEYFVVCFVVHLFIKDILFLHLHSVLIYIVLI